MRRILLVLFVLCGLGAMAQKYEFDCEMRTYPSQTSHPDLKGCLSMVKDINYSENAPAGITYQNHEADSLEFSVTAPADAAHKLWRAVWYGGTRYAYVANNTNFYPDGSAKMKKTYILFNSNNENIVTQFFVLTLKGNPEYLGVRRIEHGVVRWMAWIPYTKEGESEFYRVIKEAVKRYKFEKVHVQ